MQQQALQNGAISKANRTALKGARPRLHQERPQQKSPARSRADIRVAPFSARQEQLGRAVRLYVGMRLVSPAVAHAPFTLRPASRPHLTLCLVILVDACCASGRTPQPPRPHSHSSTAARCCQEHGALADARCQMSGWCASRGAACFNNSAQPAAHQIQP